MPRVPVDFNPGQEKLTPAQSVLPTPYAPKLPQAALFPFNELAGLSATLAKISLQQQERDNQAELEIGKKLGNDAGDDVIDQLANAHKQMGDVEYKKQLNQASFLQAEKDGKIQPSQNEWRSVGFVQSASRRVMSKYEADLIQAQSQATAVVDKDGNPVPAKPVEQVIAETWGKYKDNAFFQDYYGAKESNNAKTAIDARYRQDVANRLAANETQEYQVNTANDVSRWATTKFQKGEVSPEDLSNFDAVLNGHRLQGVDLRKALLEGFSTAAANADQGDQGEGVSHAANLLRLVQNVKVGSTTAGEDAETGPRIKALIDHYEQSQYEKKRLKVANIAADESLRNTKAEGDMDKAVQAMKTAQGAIGFDIFAQAAEMGRYIDEGSQSNRWGSDTRAVVEHLRRVQETTRVLDSKSQLESIMSALDNGKDSALASAMLDNSVRQVQLSYEDTRKAREAIDAHDATSHLLTNDSTRRAEVLVRTAARVEGITPGADLVLQNGLEDSLNQLGNDRAAFSRTLAGKPKKEQEEAMDAWNQTHATALTADTRDKVAKFLETRDKTQTEIEGQLSAWHSIDRALLDTKNGIAPAEKQAYLRREEVAKKQREDLFTGDAYSKFENERIQNGLAAAFKKDLEPAEQGVARSAIRADIRRRAETVLNELTAKATDPGEIPATFNRALLDLGVNWDKENVGGHFGTWESTLRPVAPGGKKQTLGETSAAIQKDAENADAGKSLQSESDQAKYAKAIVDGSDPLVSKETYDVIRGAYQQNWHGLFNLSSPYTMHEAEISAFTESHKILAKSGYTDAMKAKAILSMYGPVGISAEDALKGELALRTPKAVVDGLQSVADQYKKMEDSFPVGAPFESDPRHQFITRIGDVRKRIAQIQAEQPTTIPIDSGNINPYTTPMFKDNAELEVWKRTRASELRALANKYGVGDTPEDLLRFTAAQKDMNDRRRNLAR